MDPHDVATPTRKRGMLERMKGAALLDIATYEEVEHDSTATLQAAGVVGIVAICAGLGGIGAGLTGIGAGLISPFLGWLLWSGVTYLIGDKVFGGTATWGELLRTLGFAQAPGVLYIFGIIPLLGWLVVPFVWIWLLVAGVVAIRQALDFGTGKAILTALLGFVAYVITGGILGLVFGLGG